jgi:hypothetical protein
MPFLQMTILLYRFFLTAAIIGIIAPLLPAQEPSADVEIFAGGKAFKSFRDYAERDQAPKMIEVPAEEEVDPLSRYVARWDLGNDFAQKTLSYADPIADRVVAGITPSFGEIVKGFNSGDTHQIQNKGDTYQIQKTNVEHVPRSPEALAEAMAQAANGKEGTLLVVADKDKLRVMGLTHNSVDLHRAQ